MTHKPQHVNMSFCDKFDLHYVRSLTVDAALTLVQAFLQSPGLLQLHSVTESPTTYFQSMQNAVARLITRTSKHHAGRPATITLAARTASNGFDVQDASQSCTILSVRFMSARATRISSTSVNAKILLC